METLTLDRNTDTTEGFLRVALAELPPNRCRAILEAFDFDPDRVLHSDPIQWAKAAPGLLERQAGRLKSERRSNIKAQFDALEERRVRIVTLRDPEYPTNLREISDAPPILFVRGELKADDRFSVAVVGSRRATPYGYAIAEKFSRDLSARGLCIVSGGARGVDTCAHRGALEGGGRTVVFLGCGIDIDYPSDNAALFEEIVARRQGAVVSEFAPGVDPEPWRFPARNRLIAGMALGTLIIESPVDSGAMITASDAASQGRDVFAVPGPIETGRSAGCHRLIKEGAKLVETAEDVMDELGLLAIASGDEQLSLPVFQPAPRDIAPEQRKLLDMLTLQPQSVDSLIGESGLTPPQTVGALTLLEMRGLAKRVPGNAFVRVM